MALAIQIDTKPLSGVSTLQTHASTTISDTKTFSTKSFHWKTHLKNGIYIVTDVNCPSLVSFLWNDYFGFWFAYKIIYMIKEYSLIQFKMLDLPNTRPHGHYYSKWSKMYCVKFTFLFFFSFVDNRNLLFVSRFTNFRLVFFFPVCMPKHSNESDIFLLDFSRFSAQLIYLIP